MEDIKNRIQKLVEKLEIETKKKKILELQDESAQSDFWQDHTSAGEKMKELSALQKEVEEVGHI
jgi:peptide chain release factor 2